ncbi:hypothetical protein V502_03528 [Pseudogymnoascus sp. VKM F-4520 (FW-2644)]|nr:hypothetical protein V502_03528 [Pseudogymnoascus sp. VKM F-4520 (FW-2644)]
MGYRRMKHYRTAEMRPSWDEPQVALPASSNLFVITGASGAGKSRVGRYLGAKPGFIFIEGDDFLNEDDRANNGVLDDGRHVEVLAAIINEAIRQAGHGTADVVVACSALRVADRNTWRNAVALANSTTIPADGNFTVPNLHGDFHPHNNQVPYLQGTQDPYPQTLANNGFAYHPTLPIVLDIPAPALRPIHLQFVYLAISKKEAVETVRSRQLRTGHHVSETAVPAQFTILQKPLEWEFDCFKQKSLKASELTVAVEKHVLKVGSGWRACMCMLCHQRREALGIGHVGASQERTDRAA